MGRPRGAEGDWGGSTAAEGPSSKYMHIRAGESEVPQVNGRLKNKFGLRHCEPMYNYIKLRRKRCQRTFVFSARFVVNIFPVRLAHRGSDCVPK